MQQMLEIDWMYVRETEDARMCGRPLLPDAPIVIVRAAAWFIINLLFYWHRLQIKWDHKKN
jgi:hypothetical protein